MEKKFEKLDFKDIFNNNILSPRDIKNSSIKQQYPPVKFPDGRFYEGQWQYGKQNGIGITCYPDYTTYEGDYVNGVAQGNGIIVFPDGDFYIGQFDNDKQQGEGRYFQKNKEYNGQWQQGQQHGRGVQIWGKQNQHSYEGQFKQGKREGKGKLKIQGQFMYTGDFVNNKMQGFGIIKFENGNVYEGQVYNNRLHGKGKIFYKDSNETYTGDFQNDHLHGIGVYTFNNKIKYSGSWENSRMNGQGVVTNLKGEQLRGTWEQGKCIDQQIQLTTQKRQKLIEELDSQGINTSEMTRNSRIGQHTIISFQHRNSENYLQFQYNAEGNLDIIDQSDTTQLNEEIELKREMYQKQTSKSKFSPGQNFSKNNKQFGYGFNSGKTTDTKSQIPQSKQNIEILDDNI